MQEQGPNWQIIYMHLHVSVVRIQTTSNMDNFSSAYTYPKTNIEKYV
jgi:hypothetical protein